MYEDDKEKTAVQTPFGLYHHNRMAMGLRTSAQTWQRFIDTRTIHMREYTFVFVDDSISYSETEDQHVQHLRQMFEVLRANGLEVNLSKSNFCKKTVNYLGFCVDESGVRPTTEKTEAIANIKTPDTFKKLRSFVSTIQFYCGFIKDFAKTSKILTSIKQPKNQKSNKLELNTVQIEAFKKLKNMLVNATTLTYPQPNVPLILETDASNGGMGAVLNQLVEHKLEALVFHSKAFTENQLSYDTYRKELEALYTAYSKFNKYLIC